MPAERRGSTCRLTAKSYTEEEIREIAERQNLVGYPHLALMREKLSVKAKNEPKFRFYNLKRLVVETETLKCAWAQVRANKGAPGVDGVTIEDIEQSEGGAEAFIAGIQKELHEKTYRASPVRRKYIEAVRGEAHHRADIRGGLPRLLVRVQAKPLGTAGGGQDSGGDKVGEETGL